MEVDHDQCPPMPNDEQMNLSPFHFRKFYVLRLGGLSFSLPFIRYSRAKVE